MYIVILYVCIIHVFVVVGNYNGFDTEFGHSSDFSLSDVLWTCSSMLATR